MKATEIILCASCAEPTPHRVWRTNHILHIILGLLTFTGWWFTIYPATAIYNVCQKPRCLSCGTKNPL